MYYWLFSAFMMFFSFDHAELQQLAVGWKDNNSDSELFYQLTSANLYMCNLGQNSADGQQIPMSSMTDCKISTIRNFLIYLLFSFIVKVDQLAVI